MSKVVSKKQDTAHIKPKVNMVFVCDLGRENTKSSLMIFDDNKSKFVSSSKKSSFFVVTEEFKEPVQVYKIKKTNKKTGDSTVKYVVPSDANIDVSMEHVLKEVVLDGDERVMETMPTFTCMGVAFNYKKLDPKRLYTPKFTLIYSLTNKMYELPHKNKLKHEMLSHVFEITDYPNGLKDAQNFTKLNINIPYDGEDINENKRVHFNVQGSKSFYSYIYGPNLDFIPQLSSSGIIETVETTKENYSCVNAVRNQIESKFNNDALTIDLSSREMTISLMFKGNVSFKNSKTIQFGSYDVFEILSTYVADLQPSKRRALRDVKRIYFENANIVKDSDVPAYINEKFPKASYTIAELFDMAFATREAELYEKLVTAFKDLRSSSNIDPKLVILSGGGSYDNHGMQTPYIRIIQKFVGEFIDGTVKTEPQAVYKYVVPHGLYAQDNYLVTWSKHPSVISGHSIGTLLEIIAKSKK